MPYNSKALSETIEVTQPYLNATTSSDTMRLILKNIFLPISVKLGKLKYANYNLNLILDFWFLTSSTDENKTVEYRIIYPNTNSAVNSTTYLSF